MAVVERLKQESMYGLSAKKMAILERWPLVELQLYLLNLEVLKGGHVTYKGFKLV